MGLQEVWFVLVAVLFIGYFVLEGFDFGVGMLMPIVGRGSDLPADTRRRVALNTIGPVWDGNEVWLITAGGAMFAAFPEWYATLFSGFYLPLLIILVALIVRICAIEWRSKIDDDKCVSVATGASSSDPGSRQFSGAWLSRTSFGAWRSTPTSRSSRDSSICSTRTHCSAV